MLDFVATIDASEKSLLLGRNLWKFSNDSSDCSLGRDYSIYLTLSGCAEKQFTCHNGDCVSMEMRCDGSSDCQDGSDELECNTILTDTGYNKFIVPPPLGSKKALDVNLSITIFEIFDVDEVSGSITTKFSFKRDWLDPRVTYLNLRAYPSLNILTPADQQILWSPYLVFNNIRSKSSYEITDLKHVWKILRRENGSFKVRGVFR